jgi:hypothetical protein
MTLHHQKLKQLLDAGFHQLDRSFPIKYSKVSTNKQRAMIYEYCGMADGEEVFVRKFDGLYSIVKDMFEDKDVR